MNKKCVKRYISQKEYDILMELKACIANPQTLAGWSVLTRYIIIGEIIYKLEISELKILLNTLQNAMLDVKTQLVWKTGIKT